MKLANTIAALIVAAGASFTVAAPVPGSFTYQGTLNVDDEPVQTDADFIIRLYDGATFITGISQLNVPITNGLFELDLNFDPAYFDGTNYELELIVRSPAGVGVYETLNPRQLLSATPYAYHANTADTLITPTIIKGSDPGNLVTIHHDSTASNTSALRVTRGLGGTFSDILVDGVIEAESENTPIGVLGIADQFPIAGVLGPGTATVNSAAVLGQIFSGAPGGQAAVWALNSVSNNNAMLGTDDYSADLQGDVRITDGEITKNYSVGSYDLATPIAYGFVNFDGTIANGTPNFSATLSTSPPRYEIEIDNENYFFNKYITVVTPIAADVSTRTDSSGGRLIVYFENTDTQTYAQTDFQFVTFKTSGAAAIQGQPRPPLIPLNTPYTDSELNPNLPPPAPRLPIITEQPPQNPLKQN